MQNPFTAIRWGRWLLGFVLFAVLLLAGYLWAVTHWSYAEGERAGYVQKLSKKGWVCKTWEGELSLVSLPGSTAEKFLFTVHDEQVARDITRHIGKRVALHYEEKVGLPTTCFGETRYYVTGVTVSDEIPLAPGVMVPTPGSHGAPAASAASPGSAAPTVPATQGAPAAPVTPGSPAASQPGLTAPR